MFEDKEEIIKSLVEQNEKLESFRLKYKYYTKNYCYTKEYKTILKVQKDINECIISLRSI